MHTFISVDLEKCTGCRCCEMACSLYNVNQCNPEKARIRVIRSENDGLIFTIPVVCQQCERAPCLEFCPTKAMSRDLDTGAIVVDENRCIGCKRCAFVCPFGIPFIDEYRGVSVKCNLCEGSLKCVEICPKDALSLTRQDKMSIKKKREKADKYMLFLQTTTS